MPISGVYVTGPIKRGPRGVIGSNRVCAAETVAALLEDFDGGKLSRDVVQREALRNLLADRGVVRLDWNSWRAIDKAECERGRATERYRSKLVSRNDLIAAAPARE